MKSVFRTALILTSLLVLATVPAGAHSREACEPEKPSFPAPGELRSNVSVNVRHVGYYTEWWGCLVDEKGRQVLVAGGANEAIAPMIWSTWTSLPPDIYTAYVVFFPEGQSASYSTRGTIDSTSCPDGTATVTFDAVYAPPQLVVRHPTISCVE